MEAEDTPPLARAAMERFGHRLSPEQVAALVEFSRHVEAAIADLRAFELDDADEPDPPFATIERQET